MQHSWRDRFALMLLANALLALAATAGEPPHQALPGNQSEQEKPVYATGPGSGEPEAAVAHPPAEGAAAFDAGRLSLNFQDVEVRAVLHLIADFTGFNLVATDTVTGRITVRLRDVPWEQALDLILKMRGLDHRREGGVILVAPAQEIAARELFELENRRQLSELAPLVSELIQIRHADVRELFALFAADGGNGSMLSERGHAMVDERTNAIVVTDTPVRIESVLKLVRQLDVPMRQVLIESRIVTTSGNFSEQLGIRWGVGGVRNNGSSRLTYGGSLAAVERLRESGAGPEGHIGLAGADSLAVDLGVPHFGTSSFGVGITGQGYLVDLEISALAAEGRARVMARPQIVTMDKSPATIESGVEIPYQEATSSGATSTAFKDAVLSLKVTPQIAADRRIVLRLEVKQDTVGQVFNGIPSVNTNQINTEVLVEDGQTVVLGGIFQTVSNVSVDKTPLLGDLPHLGRLFQRTTERDDEQELLVFITPSVLPPAPQGTAQNETTPPTAIRPQKNSSALRWNR